MNTVCLGVAAHNGSECSTEHTSWLHVQPWHETVKLEDRLHLPGHGLLRAAAPAPLRERQQHQLVRLPTGALLLGAPRDPRGPPQHLLHRVLLGRSLRGTLDLDLGHDDGRDPLGILFKLLVLAAHNDLETNLVEPEQAERQPREEAREAYEHNHETVRQNLADKPAAHCGEGWRGGERVRERL